MEVYKYEDFMNDEKRKASPEIDFGCWWGLTERSFPADKWRISYIKDTKELYAYCWTKEVVIVLGKFENEEEVEKALNWRKLDFKDMIITKFFEIPIETILKLNRLGVK
jgi:hypothetical protein